MALVLTVDQSSLVHSVVKQFGEMSFEHRALLQLISEHFAMKETLKEITDKAEAK